MQDFLYYYKIAGDNLTYCEFLSDIAENILLHENCALLGYYAAIIDNFLPKDCPETSERNYHYSLSFSRR